MSSNPTTFVQPFEPSKLLNERKSEPRTSKASSSSSSSSALFIPFFCLFVVAGEGRGEREMRARGIEWMGKNRAPSFSHYNVFAPHSPPLRSFSSFSSAAAATLYPVADTFCHLVGEHRVFKRNVIFSAYYDHPIRQM